MSLRSERIIDTQLNRLASKWDELEEAYDRLLRALEAERETCRRNAEMLEGEE